jgi:hypothetical protein
MIDHRCDSPVVLKPDVLLIDLLFLSTVEDRENPRLRRLVEERQQVRDESQARVI